MPLPTYRADHMPRNVLNESAAAAAYFSLIGYNFFAP